eukprot:scaffold90_cov184-Alexandrium_tamarense.AAC.2
MSRLRRPHPPDNADVNRPSSASSNVGSGGRRPGEIPFVTPDGGKTRYYADRFYLDAPTGLLEYQLAQDNKDDDSADDDVQYCSMCGEILDGDVNSTPSGGVPSNKGKSVSHPTSPPPRPLFDRAKFINSLDLSAAIIGTFTVGNFDYLSNTFPKLFPREEGKAAAVDYVPTLVLHGQKGFKLPKHRKSKTQKQPKDESDESDIEDGVNHQPVDDPVIEKTSDPSHQGKHVSVAATRVRLQPIRHSAASISLGDAKTTKEEANEQSTAILQHPVFTYDNQKLELPNSTFKRRRKKKSSRKRQESAGETNVTTLPDEKEALHKEGGEKEGLTISQQLPKNQLSNDKSARESIVLDDNDSELDACDNPQKGNERNDFKSRYGSSTLTNVDAKTSSLHTPPASPQNEAKSMNLSPPTLVRPVPASFDNNDNKLPPPPKLSVANSSSTPPMQKRLKMSNILPFEVQADYSTTLPTLQPPSPTAASILAKAFGRQQKRHIFKPIYFDDREDDSPDGKYNIGIDKEENFCDSATNQALKSNVEIESKANEEKEIAIDFNPTTAFGGAVFFTKIRPRWLPPKKKVKKDKKGKSPILEEARHVFGDVEYSDDEECQTNGKMPEDNTDLMAVRGVHHPKFFLLFEKRGSLVVIISTSNLTSPTALDASWVQRFEQKELLQHRNTAIDLGMPSDFGVILQDLLAKQTNAAKVNSMVPDIFLRRYVDGLSLGLSALSNRYRFDAAQVHLVSTVPGDYSACLPKKGVSNCFNRPLYRETKITYGPQRVSFILSRVLDTNHIKAARAVTATACGGGRATRMDGVKPWLPPWLVSNKERLVIQPTSLGGNWTRDDMEIVAASYLEPHWDIDENDKTVSPLSLMDIVWPSMDYFDEIQKRRNSLQQKYPKRSVAWNGKEDDTTAGPCHVFLSSTAFCKLDRHCISRLSLFETSIPPQIPSCSSASLHIKSVCRLLRFNYKGSGMSSATKQNKSRHDTKEYISWFLLTSACLSRGAQGQPTPYRGFESDSISYANFELGVLFSTKLLGDRINDRQYVYNPVLKGCQCGAGKRWYKDLLRGQKENERTSKPPEFLQSVRKVHLPIPYRLRCIPYQQDPESDFLSHTPFMHEVLEGTGDVGNMKLTPYGQKVARENSKISADDTNTMLTSNNS